ncbi:DUF4253 domain-containing protein [Actinomadura rupiterrae]|uniref:DUF4253 domain-containing protein n=1 Tax=Actinomadura rupiterrae TaxID=559627 RepID=UPI0020A268BE|nr:DUF4253 domain-containing protein [Actinomadura rupiterrae]MCP2339847.1 hypothetical protein [Actinomadura rupiterrae]
MGLTSPAFASLPGDLPEGRLVAPEGEPVLWVSEQKPEDAVRIWRRLYADRARTGLYPLLLESLRGDDERPWLAGELKPRPTSEIDGIDVEKQLREWWSLPRPGWSGLAPPSLPHANPDDTVAEIVLDTDFYGAVRIGLVPAARGADALTAMGWTGACNNAETPPISAVLRSWEDRFGAHLVAVGFDTITLAIAAPPTTAEQAEALAIEHEAFVWDEQHDMSDEEYAEHLQEARTWEFWWD